MKLESDAKPCLTASKTIFKQNCKDGKYYGIPVEYFEVDRHSVYVKPKLARKLEWIIDERLDNIINIHTAAQKVMLDGEKYNINTGYLCSNISEGDMIK